MKRRSLRLEELGDRILPSATPLPTIAASNPPIVSNQLSQNVLASSTLTGHGHGQYSSDPVQSGAGIEYNMQGTANVGALGKVAISGSVHAVGFIQQGKAGGELTFSNAKGSVTVQLTGPTQPGFSPLPQQFSYSVVSGTGAYKSFTDTGTLTLLVSAQPTKDGSGPHGAFQVALKSSQETPPITTGVQGVAMVGPLSPVVKPGQPSSMPLPGAIITVQPSGGGAEIARTIADGHGKFELSLPPGHYLLVPLSPFPGHFLHAAPQEVVVGSTGLTSVVVNYDSGIR